MGSVEPPLSVYEPPLSVYVVDDDASIRTALLRLFASVGLPCQTFPTAADFLAYAQPGLAGCLVVDVRMPGASGLELQRMIAEADLDLSVIFVTGHADVPMTVRAMKAGALEVLTKPFDAQTLLDGVNQGLERARGLRRQRLEQDSLRARYDTLTSREREVMALVVKGLLNKQIAAALGTAEKTVKVHRAQVMHKMRADSLPALVLMATKLNAPGRQ